MEMQSANIQQRTLPAQIEDDWSFSHYFIRVAIGYGSSVTVVLAAVSYLFASLPAFYPKPLSGYAFILICLLAGIAHVLIFPRWISHLHIASTFFYSILLGIVVAIVLLFTFRLAAFEAGRLPFAAAIAFVLPALINLCWYYFSGIWMIYEKDWFIPADTVPEKRMSLLLNSVPFKVKIKMNATDNEAILFNVTLTDKLTVGNMFCRFLYDREDRVEVADDNGRQYAWHFYVPGLLGKRSLDPDKSLKINGIKEGTVILIERIRK